MLSKIKINRKYLIFFVGFLFLLIGFSTSAYLWTNDSREFKRLTEELFFSELSSSTLSLHYTLAYPEDYNFSDEVVFSSYQPGEESSEADIRSTLERLSKISKKRLNENDAYTYELLERYLMLRLSGSSYTFYEEPLSPSSGMQSGLPILLADYTFRSEKDVEDYLQILDQTDTYFEGMIQYEQAKSHKGLFMSDTSAQKIIDQCDQIMDKDALSKQTHFLHTTFEERLTDMEAKGLISSTQKEQWISENDRLLTTIMQPAYENVADAFTLLKGSGSNEMGLYYFPDGRAYYEYLLASTTGSSRSIPEIKAMLFKDFQQNYTALLTLLEQHPELAYITSNIYSSFPYTEPEEMLSDLQKRISADFPALPQGENGFIPSCTIKSVSPSMENFSSPAYYLTPPIDDMTSNIIYINHKNSPDALTLYTTLAHEGYPGHLYQTVYSQLYMNQEKTSPIRHLLHYGGYVEGWALYVENLSYQYAQALVKELDPASAVWYEACRLNRNLQLCMYSLLDIAIHYEGATPDKVAAILKKIGITDSDTVASIYQYIVEEPVNYLKYYLGFLEFSELKNTAIELWGNEFSLKRFHKFVLEAGPSDFQSLNERLVS